VFLPERRVRARRRRKKSLSPERGSESLLLFFWPRNSGEKEGPLGDRCSREGKRGASCFGGEGKSGGTVGKNGILFVGERGRGSTGGGKSRGRDFFCGRGLMRVPFFCQGRREEEKKASPSLEGGLHNALLCSYVRKIREVCLPYE